MRSLILVGAAALVAASPKPQGLPFDQLDAIPTTLPQGPAAVGPASSSGGYNSASAIAAAEAAAQPTKAGKRSVDKRTFGWFKWPSQGGYSNPPSQPSQTPSPTYKPTTTPPAVTSLPPYASVPSTCTPVSWTNTWAFTSDPACPTQIEVGTFCGFINPLDPCAAQPNAYGPPTVPDTVEAFQKNPVYSNMALNAKTPTGYVNTFKNLNASVQSNTYLTYKILQSYDVAGCASFCDNTNLCQGFNIFIERDPAWNPDQCSCDQPASLTQYKCSLYGGNVEKSAATNYGQYQGKFQIVIVASNGYEKGADVPPPTCPGYKPPTNCGTKIHDHPRQCLGQQSFPGPYNPNVCAAYANKQNAVNQKAGFWGNLLSWFGYSNGKCLQFQAVELEKDGKSWGTHCRLFTQRFTPNQATYDISQGGSSKWSCGRSWTYDLP